MKRYRTESGEVVVVDNDMVQLRTDDGGILQVPVDSYEREMQGNPGLSLATEQDIATYDTAKKQQEGSLVDQAKAGATGVARGFFSAATALPRVGIAAASALADDDYDTQYEYRQALQELSGQGTLEGASYLAAEAGGGSGEQAALETKEEAERLKEAFPTTSTVAELGGEVAGSFGLAPVARGAGALAGRLAPRAALPAAAATEGAIYSGGAALEDAAFHDKELTAQQLVGAMGAGAILGGSVGLVFDGARGVLRRGGSRGATPVDSPRAAAPSKDLKKTLEEFAEERATKALGARGSDIRKMGRTAEGAESNMRRMARDVLEHKLDDGTSVFKAVQSQDSLVENVVRARDEVGVKLGGLRERASEFVATKAKDLTPDVQRIVQRAEREILEPLKASPIPQIQARSAQVERVLAGLKTGLGKKGVEGLRRKAGQTGVPSTLRPEKPVTINELTRARVDLDNVINPSPKGPGLPPQRPEAYDELNKLRWIMEDEIAAATDKATARMGSDVAGEYATLKQKYRSFVQASQIAGKAQLQDLGNRVVSPTDYLVGAGAGIATAGTGGLASLPTAIASAAAHKAVREHASSVLAVAADRLAKNFDAKMNRSLRGFFQKHEAPARAALKAGEKSAEKKVLQLPKRPMRPVERAAVAGAATVPVALPAIKAFLGKDRDLQTAYQNRASEVIAAANDDGDKIQRGVSRSFADLSSGAPMLTSHAGNIMTRAVQYMASKLPAPVRSPSPLEPGKRLPVSPAEIRKWAKTWSAVTNPLSVLDDLERGSLSFEGVEALQVVYPRIYQQIQERAMSEIRARDVAGNPLPYRAKLRLDLLLNLGGAGEPILDPMLGLRISEIRAQRQQQSGQALAPSARTPPELSQSMRSGLEETQARAQSLGN